MTTQTKSRNKKSLTIEQKQAYKEKKKAEKLEIQDLYTKFLAKKTIQDFIGIIASFKQLHNYSIRNRILAIAQAEQREHKEFVGVLNSFYNWSKQNIKILKGSKGYKIRVPIFKDKEETTQTTIQSQNEDQQKKRILSFFKLGSVFDISQTSEHQNYLKEREEIDAKIMKNCEIDYKFALDFVKKHFPKIPIIEDFKHQEKKGSYNPLTHQITLYEKSSHTLFHEIGHLISVEILKIAGDIHKDYPKNEVLAELTAYLLMHSFGDTDIDYNFAYSNCWSNKITNTFELDEFENDFKAITQYLQQFQTTTNPQPEGEHTNGM